ncbi:hypothetical protein IF1G_00278 [Cordyceps javanica]|uniref:Uncharacterized protein n=1 Tax=Cordyceps javanica TaxID=43265 RepID=A0A545VF42_9HYPO|nr:hypothetical protein IF1G_00278 [Cordyceps javanica]
MRQNTSVTHQSTQSLVNVAFSRGDRRQPLLFPWSFPVCLASQRTTNRQAGAPYNDRPTL